MNNTPLRYFDIRHSKSSGVLSESTRVASVGERYPGVNRALVAPHAVRRDGRSEYATGYAATTTLQCEQFRYRDIAPLSRFPRSSPSTLSRHSVKFNGPRGSVTSVRPVLTREVWTKVRQDGNRLLSASLRKKKQEKEKGVDGGLDKYQHTSRVWRPQPIFPASVCGHGGDMEGGAGDCRRRISCNLREGGGG